jgi:hypothetical protein
LSFVSIQVSKKRSKRFFAKYGVEKICIDFITTRETFVSKPLKHLTEGKSRNVTQLSVKIKTRNATTCAVHRYRNFLLYLSSSTRLPIERPLALVVAAATLAAPLAAVT